MRDHLVTGISWVNFPSEATYRWWVVVTPDESKFVFQTSSGEIHKVPMDDETATGMLRVIGTIVNFANVTDGPPA